MQTPLFSVRIASFTVCLGLCLFCASSATFAQSATKSAAHVMPIEQPLAFRPNVGQEADGVRFAATGTGFALKLHARSAVLQLPGAVPAEVELELLNSNPMAGMTGVDRQVGVVNYISTSDEKSWRLGVPEFSRVEYENVYPGTALAFYARQRSLEYDFRLSAGADPNYVRMAIRGAQAAHVDADGRLVLSVGGKELSFLKPVAYQNRKGGGRDAVPVNYVLTASTEQTGIARGGAAWLLSFAVGSHDAARELVIDPVLNYGAILPGTDSNIGAMTADSAGNMYVAGQEQARGFYLAKFGPTGTNLYTTVVGSGDATAPVTGIAVDSTGKIYVAGYATTGLPATAHAYLNYTGTRSVPYVAVFPATGAAPTYLSYLGGTKSSDTSAGVAVDSTGNFYLTGEAASSDFPTTAGAYLTANPDPGSNVVFVAKFNPTLSGAASLVYSTFVGTANGASVASGIAVDSSFNAYVTAEAPLGYPVTTGAFAYNGLSASSYYNGAFVTKVNPTGTGLVYSSFLGIGVPTSVQVDGTGDAYVTGSVGVDDFPTTTGAYQTMYPAGFALELNPAGSALVFSTFLGGPSGALTNSNVTGQEIAIPAGCASACATYISGYTSATDFPAVNAVQSVIGGNPSPFVVALASGGATATFSSYLGGLVGSETQPVYTPIPATPSVGVDGTGNIYFAANMSGSDYPTTLAVPAPASYSSYIAKISPASGSLVIADPAIINFDNFGVTEVVGIPSNKSGSPVQVVLRNMGSAAVTIDTITFTPATEFSETDTCNLSIPAGGTCTLTLLFTPTASGKRTATLSVTSTAANSPLTIALSGSASATGYLQASAPTVLFPDTSLGSSSAVQTFTLTNIGETLINLTAISPTPSSVSQQYGSGTDFQVLDNCPAQLKPAASCVVSVTFTPLAVGQRAATIYIDGDGQGNPQVPLYGVGINGTSDGTLTLSATILNFNTQLINTTSAQQTITLTNTTNTPITVYSVAIATKNQATGSDFAITGGNCVSTSPVFLRPQSTCSINTRYTPTITGAESGTVTITDSATLSPHTVALSGIGLAAAQALEFSPGNYSFLDQPVGVPSAGQTIYVYNVSTAPVIIDRVLVTGDFEISSTSCPGATLKPGAAAGVTYNFGPECNVRLIFDPTATGARTGTLSFVDSAGGTQVLNLTGNGITPTGGVLVEPSSLVFPTQAIGTTSTTQHINIFNPGNAFTTITSITTTGNYAVADYCNSAFPFTMSLLSNCGVDVTFTPTGTTNLHTGSLIVTSTGGTATTVLSGTGVAATTAVGISPTSLNFGNIQKGVLSFSYTVYLRNTGTTPVTMTSGATTGDYAFSGGSCGFYSNVLAPGQSCYVQVNLTPTATGTRTGTLTLVTSAGNVTAALTGVGTATAPAVLLNPNGVGFNQQTVGTSSAIQYMYLYNYGTAPLAISTAAITTGGTAFVIPPGGDHCTGINVAANSNCYVQVQFSPTAAGYMTGTLTFTDSGHNTYPVALTGYAAALEVSAYADPTGLNFPGTVLTTTSNAQSFNLYNTSNTPLTVGALTGTNAIVGTTTTGAFSTNGTQGGNDSCSGATVAANSHCTVSVTFTPTTATAVTGTITVPVTYSNNTTAQFVVNLNGLGVAVKDEAELTPTGITFPDEALKAVTSYGADTAQYITLENLGNLPFTVGTLTSTDVVVNATTTGDFSTSSTFGASDGCTGETVAPRSYCQVSVAFTPATVGAKTGSIAFPVTYADKTTAKLTATFAGKGIADTTTVVVTPTSGQFDNQVIGTTSTNNITVTVTNTGNQPVKITTSTLTTGFSFAGDYCSGTTLQINSTCTITVAFSPTTTGAHTGTLTIPDNATGAPHKVTLTGTGLATNQQIVLSQTAINFGNQLVSTKSGAVTVFVTNQGNAAVPISSVVLGGANASDFIESDGCSGTSLTGLSYCNISITFFPAAASTGVRTATVTETDSATGSPRVILLTGTGVAAQPTVALFPATLNFGSQGLGTKSTPQTFSVTNTGTASLILKTVVSSNTAEYPITTNGCANITLAVGANCLVAVTFQPNAGSTQTGTITITDNAGNVVGTTQTVALTGVSVGIPQATLKPTSLPFGNEGVGVPSTTQAITLSDPGTDTLLISGIAITGANPTDFTQTNTCGTSITPTTPCVITVTFNPKVVGALAATVSVTDNAGNVAGSMQTATLTGTGTGVEKIAFSAPSLTFASTDVGESSASQVITVSNPGTAPTTITSIGIAPTGNFTETTTCVSPLAVGSTCTITVTFSPTAVGALTASVSVVDGAAGSPHTVALSGTGVGVATATVTPASPLTYASQAIGVASAAQVVTVSSTGTAPLIVASFKLSGANYTDFKATSTTCPATIAVGASCTISITFTPLAAGARTAILTITDNTGNVSGKTQVLTLNGTGAGVPAATISPASFAFTSQPVGGAEGPKSVILTNGGTAPLTIASIAVTGANASDFLEFDTCVPTVSAKATCEIALYFLPAAVGTRMANVVVTDNAGNVANATQTIAVTGTATGMPTVTLTATTLTFATQKVGSFSAGQAVTLMNTGNAPLVFTGVALTGQNAAEFMQFNSCSTLAPGDTCMMIAFFVPTATGKATATVTFTDNSGGTAGAKQVVTLNGTGD